MTLLFLVVVLLSSCQEEISKITITFDEQGGTLVQPMHVESNHTVELPTIEKEGHRFMGWYSGFGVNDAQFTNLSIVTDDITLYAKWEVNRYIIVFRDPYTIYKTETYDFGEEITFPEDPYVPMYSFEGWYDGTDLDSEHFTSTTMPAHDTTLYPQFSLNPNQQFDYYITGEFAGWESVYGNHDFRCEVITADNPIVDPIEELAELAIYIYHLEVTFSAESSGWITFNGYEETLQGFDGNLAFRVIRTEVNDETPIWWGSQTKDFENATPETVFIPYEYDLYVEDDIFHNLYATVYEPGTYHIILMMFDSGHMRIAVIPKG